MSQVHEIRCRKCRCVLANNPGLFDAHEKKEQRPKSFLLKDYRKMGSSLCKEVSCSHIFTKELPWMEPFIRDVSEGIVRLPRQPVLPLHARAI